MDARTRTEGRRPMAERRRRNLILLVCTVLAGSALPATAQGIWTTKAPMPAPREDVGAVAFEGRMYVLGGTAGPDAQIVRNEAYDPATDKWTALAPMPRGSHHLAVALLNGRIYTFGGFTGA